MIVVVQPAASCDPSDTKGAFANEAPRVLGFTTREELGQALSQLSGGPLEFDATAR